MKFFVVIALVSFLLGCFAVEEQEFVPWNKVQGAAAGKRLRAMAKAVDTPNLRTNGMQTQSAGMVSGGYMNVDFFPGDLCLGRRTEDNIVFKAGACVPSFDDDGHVARYIKASCFTDTGDSHASFHASTDSMCTGTPDMVLDFELGVCNEGKAATCFADLSFTQEVYRDQLMQFTYASGDEAAFNANQISHAIQLQVVQDYDGQIMNIGKAARSECTMLIPGVNDCVNTLKKKSLAYIGKDFGHGTLTVYKEFGGQGLSESMDFVSPLVSNMDGTMANYGFLKGDWYNQYVMSQ